MTSTVSIIDDDAAILDALGLLLSLHNLTTASYSDPRLFLAEPNAGGCIVSDVRMPEFSGLDLLRELMAKRDPRPVILLTGHGDIAMAVEAIKLGAFDFIEKPFDNDHLVSSIRKALVAASTTQQDQAQLSDLREKFESLTDRQRDTLRLLVRGFANKEIGQQLGISPRTVEIHRTWVMNKMAAKTLAELVRKAMALGLE